LSAVNFMIGIHNHQPVGNFGHVMEESFEKCYKPQIEVLKAHPMVRMAIHHSGPLLEWIEENRPAYLEDIAALAERGQVEILSGGFYEPILTSIPEEDAIGQVVMMNEYIKKRFGAVSTGMWLAERIWDPALPKILRAADIGYTLLDDTHFYYAGLGARDMFGYWITEKHGNTVKVFPIDKNLRYSIPFKMPQETIDYITWAASDMGVSGVTYGDDGEKFGVWPETHEWVYGQKWLENFYKALEDNSDRVRMTLFSEFIAENPPMGRIYLPPASYEEMGEWTLNADAQHNFHKTMEEISASGKKEEYKPFLRGGLWDNFLAKYEESNRMHKKMLYVSRSVSSSAAQAPEAANLARRELYRGQCNCAYWHGLFGGLYLNYLRHALYASLIRAENQMDQATRGSGPWIAVERLDFDTDGREDVVIKNPLITTGVTPGRGGAVFMLDYRPAAFCLTNTFTRRKEAYHDKIIRAASEPVGESGQPTSIHDIVRFKEEGLIHHLIYDRYPRANYQDSLLRADTSMDAYRRGDYQQLGDFIDKPWTLQEMSEGEGIIGVRLERKGIFNDEGEARPLLISKTFGMNQNEAALQAEYRIENKSQARVKFKFAVEFNMTMLAADADDRYWIGGAAIQKPRLKETLADTGAVWVGMRDDWAGFSVRINSRTHFDAWRYPVETVSQSESGFERTYQGSCIVILKDVDLPVGGALEFNADIAMVGER